MSRAAARVRAADPATTLARPGRDSSTVGSRPASASSPATRSAAARSPGPEWSPGLVVSILIRSLQRAATSSCAVASPEAGIWVTRPSSHPVPATRAREAPPGRPAAGWPDAGPGHMFAFARPGQICYRDAASQRSAVPPRLATSGWRNRQTR
jgi:hypothetical protein